MDRNILSKSFLFILIALVFYGCYLIFKPFLVEIIAAAILVSIFYTPYQKLVKIFKGRKHLASFVMCFLVALLVIIPLANFIVFSAQKSVLGYEKIIGMVSDVRIEGIDSGGILNKFNTIGINSEMIKGFVVDLAKKTNDWLVSGATVFIKGTTSFFISFLLVFFTMFFFFVDGENMVKRLMYLTPLSNKYDKEIFKKFRDVSHSTIISTFLTAIAQGIIGAIGFIIVGVPAFLAGIAMAFLSLLPYIGAAFVWFPVAVYLLVAGKIWQAIFLFIWGGVVVSLTDNIIRAYLIKGKAQVHPIFIIFSILGGILLFGFWGVVFGPLIISLAITIFHIYELEYESVLEK